MFSRIPLPRRAIRRTSLALVSMLAIIVSLAALPGIALAAGPVTGRTTGASLQRSSAAVQTASASFQHNPVGQVTLTYSMANKTLTVTTVLSGLAPNSTHPEHIHQGPCSNPNAPTKYMLNNVVADANGQARTTTVISNVTTGIPASGWSLNVHNGPNLQPAAQYTSIACATITNPNNYATVSSTFAPTNGPNENATGSARMTLNNGTLTVTLYVSGLVANSSHAAHIHAGVCPNAKQVLYDMSPLTANANGVATKTITFKNVKTIPANAWAINIHYTNDISTQTGYNPILCGTVIPA